MTRDWNRFPTPPTWRRMPRSSALLRRLWMLWGAFWVWEQTEAYFCFGPRPDVSTGFGYWTLRQQIEWRRGAWLTAADALRVWRPV